MKKDIKTFNIFVTIIFLLAYSSCRKDENITPIEDPIDDIGVSVNLSLVPYAKLSDYRFFSGEMSDQYPSDKVLAYAPASSLFTDYALKKRFVWMPAGTKAQYIADSELLDFPTGTALIKSFYYEDMLPNGDTKIIETRVMIKKSTGWIFAEYVWNDDQTEAFLQMDGSYQQISWLQDGNQKSTNYRIPSAVECLICHKSNNSPVPIGLKPQNLNIDYEYDDGAMNQIQKLIQEGYLQPNVPGNIVSTVNYSDPQQPLDLRLRSYLDINCAHCHAENSHCDYRPMRLAFSETALSINMGVCVEPDEFINPSLINIITPGNINKSMMHFRLASAEESIRMPLLGRSLVHQEGLELLTQYIQSISDCD